MNGAWIVIAAFAFGSVPFGYVLVRAVRGTDIRDVGSGNIGATNVGRALGTWGWVATLLADAGKGGLAVGIALWLAPGEPRVAAAAAVAAITGHCFTPWLGGRGGKGVATMLGAFAVLSPAGLVAALAAFAAVVAVTRFVSLASLVAAPALALAAWWLGEPIATVVAALATTALVVVRHRANIHRLAQGTESRIGGRS